MQNRFARLIILVTLRSAKAGMAELVDAPDLGSGALGRAGSIPVPGISLQNPHFYAGFLLAGDHL